MFLEKNLTKILCILQIKFHWFKSFYKRFDKIGTWNSKKLETGDLSEYELKNREERQFEKFLVIDSGISFHDVGRLIFINGMMNDFAFAQTSLF